MATRTILILFPYIMGCSQQQEPYAHAKNLLLHHPKKVAEYINSLSTDEQVFVVTQLSEDIPQRIRPLCTQLTGAAKDRCLRIASRPHLWKDSNHTKKTTVRTSSECSHPHLCAEKRAIDAIQWVQVEKARTECSQIQKKKWKDECLFHISEVLLDKGFVYYQTVLELCQEAQTFTDHCLQHSIFSLVQTSLEKKHNIEDFSSLALEFQDKWTHFSANQSAVRTDQLWSHWIYRTLEADPEALPNLPSHLLHHYHSSIALDGVRFGSTLELDMEKHLRSILARKIVRRTHARGLDPSRNLWTSCSFQAGVYLGFSQRIIDDDPTIDILLATLEGIARLQPPQKKLLLPYRDHPHPKVQATVKRLLGIEHSAHPHRPLLSKQAPKDNKD